jgi:hypothetical protein
MPKKRPSLREDANERAYRIVQAMTGDGPRPEPPGSREKNPEAVKRGRAGGKVGGKARAAKLSARRRKLISKKASEKRWPPKQ